MKGEQSQLETRASHNLPWFWYEEASDTLYVDKRHAPLTPTGNPADDPDPAIEVRVKDSRKAEAIGIQSDSEHFYVRGITFFGTGGLGGGPRETAGKYHNYDVRLENCRFLYSPVQTKVITTKKSSRGGGERVRIWNNTIEFCEHSMFYKASAGEVAHNYFAFNAFEQAGSYTVKNQAMRSVFHHNTLLYNGDKGGHINWARGNHIYRNLIIGQVTFHLNATT